MKIFKWLKNVVIKISFERMKANSNYQLFLIPTIILDNVVFDDGFKAGLSISFRFLILGIDIKFINNNSDKNILIEF